MGDVSGPQGMAHLTPGPVSQTGMRRFLPLMLAYGALALALTWPVALHLGTMVPGADRTDLWTSLWTLDFVAEALSDGRLPFATKMLLHPDGGVLLARDLLGSLIVAPLTLMVGVEIAYTVLVWLQLAFAGVMAHGFAREWLNWRLGRSADQRAGAAWVAGVAYCSAPVLLSAIHNGQPEAIAGGFAAWAAWMCWRAAAHGGRRRVELAIASLAVAALGSWEGAATAFFFAAALGLLGAGDGLRTHLRARLLVLGIGLAVVVPMGLALQQVASSEQSLVPPITAAQAADIRRSLGAADPVAYFMPGPYRSPDLQALTEYGDRRIQVPYLGWSLMGLGLLGLRRRGRGTGFLWLAGVTGVVLSLGPVVVRHGEPLLLAGRKVLPLPYFLVESLPGLDSLTMLYRLAQAPALALALLAAAAVSGRRVHLIAVAVGLIVLEGRWAAPTAGLPASTPVGADAAIQTLASAPEGAVMTFPVVRGRAYAYEQVHHQKPLAGSLSHPTGPAAEQLWSQVLEHAQRDPTWIRTKISTAAKRLGIRYVLIHVDPDAQPDRYTIAIDVLERAYLPMELNSTSEVSTVQTRMLQLW